MTSLAELRAIEEERVAQERAAIVAAAESKRRAIEEAEAKRLADEAARLAAEREAAIAVERAREAAEREARMKVEAAEAAERMRLMAALEQERLAGELELRRAEVAKKRPTWMVAVTAAAVIATGAFAWFAIDQMKTSEAAAAETASATERTLQAKAIVEQAQRDLDAAQKDLLVLGEQVDKGLADLEVAKTADQQRRAEENLRNLRQRQRDAEERIREQKRIRDKKVREGGLHIDDKCKHNALAKECM